MESSQKENKIYLDYNLELKHLMEEMTVEMNR